jgi:SAM-dependent methyltransferase
VACAQLYPVLSGIPVLLHRPRAALRGSQAALEQCAVDARETERRSQWALRDHPSEGLAQRIERWRRGTAANLELIRRYSAPIHAYLEASPEAEEHELLDFASSRDIGWTPNALLPYFHQDWCNDTGFDRVLALVGSALTRHAVSAHKVAVLGAGACGLAHALASRSERVYAVDLCLPALLMAQAVMRGDTLRVSLEKAGWRPVDIQGPRAPAPNLTLIQANVNALPFADGSLSAVVTQYLLDLMGNPLWLAAEIRRVLAPGGIWINFSNPFPMPGEAEEIGRPDLAEASELLGTTGFRVVDSERHEFVLNDIRAIDPAAVSKRQEVHLFVARKPAQHRAEDHGRRWMRDPGWWQCTVKNVPGLDIKALREHRLDPGDGPAVALLSIAGQTVALPEEIAVGVAALFQVLDAGLPLESVAARLEDFGLPLTRAELRELVHYSSEHYGFVRLSEPHHRAL